MNESEKRAVDIHVATLEARVKELETEVANLSRDLDKDMRALDNEDIKKKGETIWQSQ